MKKAIAIFCTFVLCLALTGCKKSAEIKYQNNNGLVFCTDDNVTEEVAKALSKSKKELKASMKESGVVFYGISSDNSFTVSVTRETTDFSKEVVDFSAFNEEKLSSLAEEIAPNLISYYKTANEVYIVQDTVSYTSEGEHPARQYITVKNGSFYIITFTFAGENLKTKHLSSVQSIVNDISIGTNYENISLYSAIIIVLILAVISVIVYVAVTLIKDLKKAKKDKKSADN